ncbi:hypothetical protein [Nocardiopsis synnemataformans]|uniref:hypothetical protein n=1 Tax=Nocardiopsis synnemataformans TaxID=61305 RepID=UPI003EBC19CE
MATAACGRHPHWPDVWLWDRKADELELCAVCKEESTVDEELEQRHVQVQQDAALRAMEALHNALAEMARARQADEAVGSDAAEHCEGDCCPRQVEVEDLDAELVQAERSVRNVLRILSTRVHRQDVVLEGEQR